MSTQQESIIPLGSEALPLADVVIPRITQAQLAWQDIKDGIKNWRVWLMLAYSDIRLRYRRSVLGPFWITISMAITVYSMGYLYSQLFHQDLQHYYPYLVSGMLSWSLISTMVTELTDAIASTESLIKQVKLPYSLYVHRIIARNIIIFFHNLLVMIPIMIFFHQYTHVNWNTLLFIPGLVVIYANSILYGLVLSMIGARYRDVSQIIKSLVQVVFFITPIMWSPEILSDKLFKYIIALNPFYAFLELVRAPLLGQTPTFNSLMVVFSTSLIGLIISFKIFARYRARIVYWI